MSKMSIPSRMLDRLVNFMTAGRSAATPEPRVEMPQRVGPYGGLQGMGWLQAYYASLERPGDRKAEMTFYDYLEIELSDIPKVLDAYATMTCTGTLTGESHGSYTIRLPSDAPQQLKDWMKIYERAMQAESYSIIRGQTKYGSYTPELVIGNVDGKLGVIDFNHLPPGTMFRKLDGGDEKYWEQKLDTSYSDNKNTRTFSRWRIPHFATWSQVVSATKVQIYGTSMLKPTARLGLQLQTCIDAMVVARMARAPARYKYTFDISDIKGNEPAILKRGQDYSDMVSKQRQSLDTGQFDSYRRAAIPDQDFVVPGADGLKYDVELISGDANVGNIKDVEYLTRSYLGSTGVPPQYLGHGGEGGGRSNLSQVDINFARACRYLQMYGAIGFTQGAIVHMILGGWDPEQYPPEAVPPQIGARDELLHAQIRLLQSQVINNLVQAGMDPTQNPRWVLATLMNMGQEIQSLTDSDLDKLFTILPIAMKAATGTNRPDRAASAKEQELLGAVAAGTQDFIRNIRDLIQMDDTLHCAVQRSGDRPTVESLRRGVLQAL